MKSLRTPLPRLSAGRCLRSWLSAGRCFRPWLSAGRCFTFLNLIDETIKWVHISLHPMLKRLHNITLDRGFDKSRNSSHNWNHRGHRLNRTDAGILRNGFDFYMRFQIKRIVFNNDYSTLSSSQKPTRNHFSITIVPHWPVVKSLEEIIFHFNKKQKTISFPG